MSDKKNHATFRPHQSVMWCDSERGRNWSATIRDICYGVATITIRDNDWPCRRWTIRVRCADLLPVD